jgi:anti-sigma B factor antagonist
MGTSSDPESTGALVPADISVTTSPGQPGWTVVVRGEIDIATSPELRRQLEQVADDDEPIVVDVSDMTFIDSSGLGVLVEVLKRRRETGGQPVALRGMQEPVRRVFEITGLTDLFEVQ